MLPPLSSMKKLEVYVFAHGEEGRGFDVLIETAPGFFTQGVLKIDQPNAPLLTSNLIFA